MLQHKPEDMPLVVLPEEVYVLSNMVVEEAPQQADLVEACLTLSSVHSFNSDLLCHEMAAVGLSTYQKSCSEAARTKFPLYLIDQHGISSCLRRHRFQCSWAAVPYKRGTIRRRESQVCSHCSQCLAPSGRGGEAGCRPADRGRGLRRFLSALLCGCLCVLTERVFQAGLLPQHAKSRQSSRRCAARASHIIRALRSLSLHRGRLAAPHSCLLPIKSNIFTVAGEAPATRTSSTARTPGSHTHRSTGDRTSWTSSPPHASGLWTRWRSWRNRNADDSSDPESGRVAWLAPRLAE
mmetsp:Transcript_8252/g.15204  ORF Transcript_8252/g.15204 Transcript_8252/m.15204 type:complete len:294 (+) Transcript_8252:61-942(+)